jgi:protein SCO1
MGCVARAVGQEKPACAAAMFFERIKPVSPLKIIRYLAWAAVAVLAAAAGLGALGWTPGSIDPSRLPLAATVGGPFELTSHEGRRFNSRELGGKPFAVFFGFTNCPDVCPTTMLELTNRMEELGADADKLRLVFITVDPAQDTPAHLKTYIGNFDKRLIALTGTADEIAAVAKAYRAIYAKVPTKEGYTMDHTATVYLMNAKGQFAGTIAYQENAETQRTKLKKLVAGL